MTNPASRPGLLYTPTSLAFKRGQLTLDEWLAVCRDLGAMAQGHQWWIGDALVEGERRFGEEWSQAEAILDEAGIPTQTQLNWRWVASRIQASRRRENLSWSHHAEVARLEPDEQDALLEQAEKEGWTVRELRDHVTLENPRPRDSGDPAPPTGLTEAELAAIARRLETLHDALESWKENGAEPATLTEFVDGDDVAWLIRTLRYVTRGGEK